MFEEEDVSYLIAEGRSLNSRKCRIFHSPFFLMKSTVGGAERSE